MSNGSKLKDLYIIGAGGFGRETVWMAERINEVNPIWNICGFIDDDESLCGSVLNGYAVLGNCDYLRSVESEYWTVCAVANVVVRKKIIDKILCFPGIKFATLIDPDVKISRHDVSIGEGSIICMGSILTVDIRIGKHNIVNLDCTVGHDAVLKDFVTLYPSVNISGNVVVDEVVEIGTGVQIIQGKKIGHNTIIGAGAVAVKDMPPECTAVGNPARVIKGHDVELPVVTVM